MAGSPQARGSQAGATGAESYHGLDLTPAS